MFTITHHIPVPEDQELQLRKFGRETLKITHSPCQVLLASLTYTDRYFSIPSSNRFPQEKQHKKNTDDHQSDEKSIRSVIPIIHCKLFLAALMTGHKYCSDTSLLNVAWMEVCGDLFTIREINNLERDFLQIINYGVIVEDAETQRRWTETIQDLTEKADAYMMVKITERDAIHSILSMDMESVTSSMNCSYGSSCDEDFAAIRRSRSSTNSHGSVRSARSNRSNYSNHSNRSNCSNAGSTYGNNRLAILGKVESSVSSMSGKSSSSQNNSKVEKSCDISSATKVNALKKAADGNNGQPLSRCSSVASTDSRIRQLSTILFNKNTKTTDSNSQLAVKTSKAPVTQQLQWEQKKEILESSKRTERTHILAEVTKNSVKKIMEKNGSAKESEKNSKNIEKKKEKKERDDERNHKSRIVKKELRNKNDEEWKVAGWKQFWSIFNNGEGDKCNGDIRDNEDKLNVDTGNNTAQ
ncbi:hypothetical protein HK100_000260 [Physocladia obscura]|uniref:Cyclin N-terminal domain-containing protein n=1 Tax=Physocladia obscura TaxID=109957 RepID=A0AAD5T4P0_9FUNG|nr:hypothetical protein HK100_000260 [Physocladia obscura]